MNLLNDDLMTINFQFLMLVRECARHSPMEAIWKFNLKDVEIERISSMSFDEIKELANCGRAILTILPITQTQSDITPRIVAALLPVSSQV
jgi:hypothetical protein